MPADIYGHKSSHVSSRHRVAIGSGGQTSRTCLCANRQYIPHQLHEAVYIMHAAKGIPPWYLTASFVNVCPKRAANKFKINF